MSLVAMLIPVASQPPPFSSLAAQGVMAPPHDGPLVRSALLSLFPPAFTRQALNRGLQHPDIMVKHACLRILYEALVSLRRWLEAVDAAAAACSEPVHVSAGTSATSKEANASPHIRSGGDSGQMSWLRLSQSIQDTMRTHLPNPNILYGILHSRKASSSADGNGTVTTPMHGATHVSAKKRKRADSDSGDGVKEQQVPSSENYDYESTILQLWGPEAGADAGRRKDGEVLLHSKVLEVLAAYQRVLPTALVDTGFDAFKLLPDNPLAVPIVHQNALTILLLAVTEYTTSPPSDKFGGVKEFVGVGSAYKKLRPLLLLMLGTDSKDVSQAAYNIIERIMYTTGAFGVNPSEIRLWLDALIGWKVHIAHELRTAGESTDLYLRNSLSPGTIHTSLVNFLADAVGSIGQNIYRYLDRLHHNLSKFTLGSDVHQRRSPSMKTDVAEFGPFVICTLDTCFRTIRSESKTIFERAAVAAYVANVLYMLLKYQVHPQALASVLLAELSSETDTDTVTLKTSGWSPLQTLLQHCEELLPATQLRQLNDSSRRDEVGQAQNPEAGKLLAVLKACKDDMDAPTETKLEALRSILLCIPVDEVLDKFPSIMEVCTDFFDGDSSTLVALLGVHRNFLVDVSTCWPELFSLALELAGAVKDRVGETVSAKDLRKSALKSVNANIVSGAVGLCALLLRCPFSVLFSAAVHGNCGQLLTNHAFTNIVKAAALKVPPSGWLSAVRVVIAGVKHLFVMSTGERSAFDTCFSLLCSFSSPTQLNSVDSIFTAIAAYGENIMADYRRMIIDLLNHPALYDIFLCSDSLSNSSCPFLFHLRRDKKDGKVFDMSLKRVLATAASQVTAVDGHILVFFTRLLESIQTLCKSAVSSPIFYHCRTLEEDALEACASFVRKAVTILQKEMEKSSNLGVLASPSLFAVSVLIPYSDLSFTIDFLLSLLSVGRTEFKISNNVVAPHVVGLHFAMLFIDSLSGATEKNNLLTRQSAKWKWEQNFAKDSESQLIFDLFERVSEQVISKPSVLADLCMLSFLQALDPKLAVRQNSEQLYRRFDKTRFADLARCTSLAVLKHCIMRPNQVTSSIATLLVESSSVHLSEFGWLVARGTANRSEISSTGCRVSFADKILGSSWKHQTLNLLLSSESLLIFLPTVKVYLEVKLAEGHAEDKDVVDHVTTVYGTYLGRQVKRWERFVSNEALNEWYGSTQLARTLPGAYNHAPGRMLEYYHQSPIGQVVQILRLCHSFHPLSKRLQHGVFKALLSKDNSSLVSLDGPLIADEDICRLVCEVVAKVDILRYLIDNGLKLESGDVEEKQVVAEEAVDHVVDTKVESQMNSLAAQKFLASLVYTLGKVYKCGGIDWKKETPSPSLQAQTGRAEWLHFLEQLLLDQVTHTAEGLSELSMDLPSFMPVYKYSLATFLGYRYGEPSAMKVARYLTILLLRCMEENKDIHGQAVDFNALDLLVSHSKFLSSLLARDSRRMEVSHLSGKYAGKGTALNSLTSVLLLVGSPLVDHLDERVEDKEASAEDPASMDANNTSSQNSFKVEGSDMEALKKIELVKLLRILVTLRLKQCKLDMASSESPPLEQLLSVLLAAYGGTMSELDQEIFSLMHEIESHGGPGFPGLSGLDYLWGEAALQRRKAKSLKLASSKSGQDEPDRLIELRKQTFREDLDIDPRRCGLTVLFFPPRRPMPVPNVGYFLLANQFKDSSQEHQRKRIKIVGSVERELKSAAYDPAFLLPFAVHGLSLGFVSAEEFVRLGLLAVAFASISSADETMRKSGYEALAKYYAVLESCPSFKSRTQIRLLLTYVKNSVAEGWQKFPLVLSVFAAEASCILMNPENHHYLSINRFLLRGPSLDTESIPLFQVMFGSGSVLYRSDRLWMLRLLAAGLGSSLDAHIYRRKFVLELLMSFHDSAMADAFTRKWVLQVLYQAAYVRSCANYLVEHTGLLSWLASVAVNDCESNSSMQENGGAGELASMSLKVIESILSWEVVQRHLLTIGSEELSKVAFMFHRFLVRSSISQYQKIFSRPTINIMTSVLRMSHRRRKHQTHLTLNLVGIQEVINWVEGGMTTATGSDSLEERTNCLKMILLNSPPPVITVQDKVLLHSVASWAMQVALQKEFETVSGSDIPEENLPQRKKSGLHESNFEKLLRWLAAALLLGDMSRVSKLTDMSEKFTTCFTVVSLLKKAESTTVEDIDTSIDTKLARVLLSLQGRMSIRRTEVSSLVTVVAAIARLTPFRGFTTKGVDECGQSSEKIESVLELLLSELPCPQEISPSWLWSFGGPWIVHGSHSVDDHGDVYSPASYVSEVCAAILTFLQLLWSKRHKSLSSYLRDLEACLAENRFGDSSSPHDDDSHRDQVITKLALLQEKFCHTLQQKPLKVV